MFKQIERKLLFHWLILVYGCSLSNTNLHFSRLLNNLDLKVFSSGCSQHAFQQIDFWRTLTVRNQSLILSKIVEHLYYRIGVNLLFRIGANLLFRIGANLLFSGKGETLENEFAGNLLFPMLLLLWSGYSIAPYRT